MIHLDDSNTLGLEDIALSMAKKAKEIKVVPK